MTHILQPMTSWIATDIVKFKRDMRYASALFLAIFLGTPFAIQVEADASGEILQRLGTSGPYVKQTGTGIDPSTPEGCRVTRVVSLARHGERLPGLPLYKQMLATVLKLKYTTLALDGPLAFIKNYSLFMEPEDAGTLTRTGCFSGSNEAIRMGKSFMSKYGELADCTSSRFKIYAGNSGRVIDTAQYFAEGLFGENWNTRADVIRIKESVLAGANSLSPSLSCLAPQKITDGYLYPSIFYESATKPIIKRLNKYVTGRNKITKRDVRMLHSICPFELNAVGESQFCDIFTKDEWDIFEYREDLATYYRTGPGSPSSRSIGGLFLNATLTLLDQQESESQRIYPCFGHDIDLHAVVTALGIFDSSSQLPSRFPRDKDDDDYDRWRISQITPMGARLVFEQLNCNTQEDEYETSYVRVLLNDAIVTLDNCDSGPGMSCPQDEFREYIKARIGNYAKECRVPPFIPRKLTFFWDTADT